MSSNSTIKEKIIESTIAGWSVRLHLNIWSDIYFEILTPKKASDVIKKLQSKSKQFDDLAINAYKKHMVELRCDSKYKGIPSWSDRYELMIQENPFDFFLNDEIIKRHMRVDLDFLFYSGEKIILEMNLRGDNKYGPSGIHFSVGKIGVTL